MVQNLQPKPRVNDGSGARLREDAVTALRWATIHQLQAAEDAKRRRRAAVELDYPHVKSRAPDGEIAALIHAAQNDSSIEVRKQATFTLMYRYRRSQDHRKHIRAERMLELTLVHLQDKNAEIRRAGAFAAKAMGSDAAPATLTLIELLDDPEYRVRFRAIQALGAIGMHAKQAEHELEKLLDDDDERIRKAARDALKMIKRL